MTTTLTDASRVSDALLECESGLHPDEVLARLVRLARVGERCDATTAFYLLDVEQRRLHDGFGYPSTVAFADAKLNCGKDKTYRLIRAARACARHEALRLAYEGGEIAYSKIDVIAPFLSRPDAALWLERAKTMSGPVLRQLAEQERRFGRPTGPNQRLKAELDAEQWKLFQLAAEKVRKIGGGELPVAEIIEVLAVNFLQTPFDESELAPDEEDPASELHTATDEGEAETGTSAEEADEIERGRSFRRQKLEEADYQCEMECDRRTDLQVDHIEPRSRNPARKWDPDNCCVACVACHRLKTAGQIRVHGRNEDGALAIERPVRWRVFAGPDRPDDPERRPAAGG